MDYWKPVARRILETGKLLRIRDSERAGNRCLEDNRDFGSINEPEVRGYYRKVRPERPGTGVEPEELRGYLEGDDSALRYRAEEKEPAIEAWCRANVLAQLGKGPVPLAVVLKRGENAGTILYRSSLGSLEETR